MLSSRTKVGVCPPAPWQVSQLASFNSGVQKFSWKLAISSVRAVSPLYNELEPDPEPLRSGRASVDCPEPHALRNSEALNNSNNFDSLLLKWLMVPSPNLVISRGECLKIFTLKAPCSKWRNQQRLALGCSHLLQTNQPCRQFGRGRYCRPAHEDKRS